MCASTCWNIFGFEYLIAPYTIAHLKLSQYLSDQGHSLKGNERLQVFLTNTLEPIKPQANFLLPAISAEVEAAQTVKDREILVIVGNPPYSGDPRTKGHLEKYSLEAGRSAIEVAVVLASGLMGAGLSLRLFEAATRAIGKTI